jgi:hypothetical protein
MVSSNLVMSDRRVSRRVRRGTICGSVDLESHFSTVSASDARRGSCQKEPLFWVSMHSDTRPARH